MAIGSLALVNIDEGESCFYVTFTFVLTGNYGTGASHGDTLNFNTLPIPSSSIPFWVDIFEMPTAGTAPNGYVFGYASGTVAPTRDSGVMTIFNNLGEYTPGSAYSAGLLGASMRAVACFLKNI